MQALISSNKLKYSFAERFAEVERRRCRRIAECNFNFPASGKRLLRNFIAQHLPIGRSLS